MTFFFGDGTEIDMETSQSHSFIQHDLSWAALARGGLSRVSYASSNETKPQPIKTLEARDRQCRSRLTRMFNRKKQSDCVAKLREVMQAGSQQSRCG